MTDGPSGSIVKPLPETQSWRASILWSEKCRDFMPFKCGSSDRRLVSIFCPLCSPVSPAPTLTRHSRLGLTPFERILLPHFRRCDLSHLIRSTFWWGALSVLYREAQ
ncbi:hypothetical protein WJX75_007806 [Coccomyxa subellipsoidea]|uniref:Uncharacterized protein n=1 Tax=Coccomyxa subellipsoidea TaxID=248742 RepID=A0ABR2YT92_9CHLO